MRAMRSLSRFSARPGRSISGAGIPVPDRLRGFPRPSPRAVWAGTVLIALLGLSPRGSVAGEPALTLDQAIARVLAHHPLVAASQADVEMADAGRLEAVSQYLPRIDLGEGYTRSDNPVFAFGSLLNQGNFTQNDFNLHRLNNPASLDNFQTRLSLSQTILSLPALAAVGRARDLAHAASTGKDFVREQLAMKTVEAFTGVVLAGDAVQVAEEVGKAARSNLDRARALVRAGATLESDSLQAEVRVREVEEAIILAKGNERVARLGLESLLGEPVGEIEPPPARAESSALDQPLESLVTQAFASRPDVAALIHNRDAARRALQAARTAFLPTLNFFVNEEWDNAHFASDGSSSYMLGLNLGWNLFAGGGDRARVLQAKAALDKAEAMLEAHKREVRLDIASAATNLQAAHARNQAAQGGSAQAAEALRILSRSYEEGLSTAAQLLGGEAAFAQARLREIQAVHEVRTADAHLQYALGSLTRQEPAASAAP